MFTFTLSILANVVGIDMMKKGITMKANIKDKKAVNGKERAFSVDDVQLAMSNLGFDKEQISNVINLLKSL